MKSHLAQPVLPSYDFSKANVIVGIAADFLGSWCASIENTKQYALTREVSKEKMDDVTALSV